MSRDEAALPRIVERDAAVQAGLAELASPLLQRLYAGRGVTDADELEYSLARLPHYRDLHGIDTACDLLETALISGHRILVVGDFDADGATSTALVCDVLEAMGAGRVDHFVPHRARHGYGLSPAVVEAVGHGDTGDLIVTVDNGIASVSGVEAAHAAGWQVLVCDHHLPGDTLPAAEAIVNPNQPGCAFAGKTLAGVGVAFYLMAALRARLAERDPNRALPRMSDYLDLVAVGTVADVVALDHLNRTLVSQGLRRIRRGLARPGIAALIEVAGRDATRLNAADIGFAVGPRLNAAGRLEDMSIGIACLRATDGASARTLASELSAINRQRQSVQRRMQEEADTALAALDQPPAERAALVVYSDDWHEGIVGLIASRLRERHGRPVIAFAPGAHGLLKGSARSINGLHIRDVLAAIDARHDGLMAQFGGHAQAAGLALRPEAIGEFEKALESVVAERLTPAMLSPDIVTDGALADEELALDTARLLESNGPWGAGFDEPLFHGVFEIVSQRIVGEKHLKLEVRPVAGSTVIEAMRFNHGEMLDAGTCYQLVYRLAVNVFRERTTANLIVIHHRSAKGG
ncbi:single-stranded-DNA-specific exonuclease RecJ [Salinisphaera dokdonensis CL-ES53]|uniref:Single-stranded-DNA-specific exonuclease RecJ n=1 Tax=Salinisphaera dokdonensis CL-ES53 TaxID=1304272 RepID=A0ABV2B4K0_9GAMM